MRLWQAFSKGKKRHSPSELQWGDVAAARGQKSPGPAIVVRSGAWTHVL